MMVLTKGCKLADGSKGRRTGAPKVVKVRNVRARIVVRDSMVDMRYRRSPKARPIICSLPDDWRVEEWACWAG